MSGRIDRKKVTVSECPFIDPERTGLPSVRKKKFPLSCIRSPAGIAEHVVIFVFGMVIDLQQYDGTLLQSPLDGVRRDPGMEAHADIFPEALSPQAAAQKNAGQEIRGAAEVPQHILVPIDAGAPSDPGKAQEHIVTALVGYLSFFKLFFQCPHNIHCCSRTAVAFITVFQVHKLACSAVGSKGDP